MIGPFALAVVADGHTFIAFVVGRQGTDASRRQQLGLRDVESAFLLFVSHRRIRQGGSQHHVGTHLRIILVAVHKVVETVGLFIYKGVGKRGFHLVGHRLPFLQQRTLGVGHLQQLDSIAQGVVPKGIHLDGQTSARRPRLALSEDVHPREGQVAIAGIEQAIVQGMHIKVRAGNEALQDGRHGFLVFLPDVLLVLAEHLLVELQHIEEPQRRIDRRKIQALLVVTVGKERPLHPFDQVIQRFLEGLFVALRQGDAWQRQEHVAAAAAKPREACPEACALRVANNELVGGLHEAVLITCLRQQTFHLGLALPFDGGGVLLLEADGEDDRVALLHLKLEETGDELVFDSIVTTLLLTDIEHVVVPMRNVRIFRHSAELQIESRIVLVELPRCAVFHQFRLAVGFVVLVRQHVDVAES